MGTEPSPVRFAGAPYVRGISTYRQQLLMDGWSVARVAAGTVTTLAELNATTAEWHDADVPGTVASAMRRAGRLPALEQCEDFDTHDWWFRCRFPASAPGPGERSVLHFAG